MEPIGSNYGFLLVQLFDLVILLGWPLLSLLALIALRARRLAGTTLAIWVLIIVAVPLLGALAFWVVRPGDQPSGVRAGPREP